jgi:hypothetical protein
VRLATLFALLLIALSTQSLRADLIGTSVSGSLYYTYSGPTPAYGTVISYNLYDPAALDDTNHTLIPLQYSNSAGPNNITIGAATEFGYEDSNGVLLITADFTDSALTITETCQSAYGCTIFGDLFTFTDPAFTNLTLLSDPSNFIEAYGLVGNTITIRADSPVVYDTTARILYGTDTAVFSVDPTPSAVPEPGSLVLLSTGVLATLGFARCKKSQA